MCVRRQTDTQADTHTHTNTGRKGRRERVRKPRVLARTRARTHTHTHLPYHDTRKVQPRSKFCFVVNRIDAVKPNEFMRHLCLCVVQRGIIDYLVEKGL